MIVLSWSKATRDLLKSLGWGIRALHQLGTATMVPSPRRLPHTISPLEGEGFEPSVPRRETTLRDCLLIEEVRFAADSPLEGDGFEPSVPPAGNCATRMPPDRGSQVRG